jgi:hypothetical protein
MPFPGLPESLGIAFRRPWKVIALVVSGQPIRANANKVQSLTVEANLANWDRDADADGIELRIVPRMADGHSAAIDGALRVDLIARNYSPAHREPAVATLGQWSQPVRAAGFREASGAVFRLPFQSLPPDFDPTLQSIGLLRVHVNVSGQGDFFADTTVRIRSYNPIRDQLLEHGTHHDSFGRYRARHW